MKSIKLNPKIWKLNKKNRSAMPSVLLIFTFKMNRWCNLFIFWRNFGLRSHLLVSSEIFEYSNTQPSHIIWNHKHKNGCIGSGWILKEPEHFIKHIRIDIMEWGHTQYGSNNISLHDFPSMWQEANWDRQ